MARVENFLEKNARNENMTFKMQDQFGGNFNITVQREQKKINSKFYVKYWTFLNLLQISFLYTYNINI